MKVTFREEELELALGALKNIINPHATLPVLSNVLLRARKKENKVIMFGSDLVNCLRCEVEAKVEKDGELTLPALRFSEIVQYAPSEGEVVLAKSNGTVMITFDHYEYELTTLPAKDFPEWPEVKEESSFQLPQGVLRKAIEKIKFGIPTRDPRRALMGGYFKLAENQLTCVGTDGRRLGCNHVPVEGVEGATETSAIIPLKALEELERILLPEGLVRVRLGSRQAVFELGKFTLVTNKIEAEYPDYELVIPREFHYEVMVAREELMQLIRRASPLAEQEVFTIFVHLQPGRLEMTSRTPDLGSFKGSIPIEYDGQEFQIAFNYKFLLEILGLLREEKVLLRMVNAQAPVIVNAMAQDNPFFLLMPIRLAEEMEEEES